MKGLRADAIDAALVALVLALGSAVGVAARLLG